MCRARPGPRCSNQAAKRIKSARDYHANIAAKCEREEERSGEVSAATQRQMRNAQNRLKAAQRVWLGTPKGQEELQDKIDKAEKEFETMPKGTTYSKTRMVYNAQKRELKELRRTQEKAKNSRSEMYKDLHLVRGDIRPGASPTQGERRRSRDSARARGGSVNMVGQPSLQREFDEDMAKDRAAAMNVQSWDDETYDRANNWVEEGTRTGWYENIHARPNAKYGAKDAPTVSRSVRLNTPDGQIVEGRADVHLTKKGSKYFVSERLTTASSWEDASPIDVTKQEIGHIIAAKRGVNRSKGDNVVEFKTKKEALAYQKRSQNALNQRFVKDVAKMGREGLVGRAHKHHEELQKRGFKVWPRYKEDKEPTQES